MAHKALPTLPRPPPIAHHSQKKAFNLDAIKKNAKFLKNSWIVTVFDKIVCYNGLENMKSATLLADKSAIRNLKSEMGGPYLSNPSVIIRAYHGSAIG